MASFLEDIKNVKENKGKVNVSSGLNVLGGIEDGNLIVIETRPNNEAVNIFINKQLLSIDNTGANKSEILN